MSNANPDRMRELEERRDFLLRSIDDLEREHEAGDLTEADFNLLHRDYSRRAADVLKELEEVRGPVSPSIGIEPTPLDRAIAKKARTLRGFAWVAIVVFAVLSGVFVAKIAGVRSNKDSLTGTVRAAEANTTAAQVQKLIREGREQMAADPVAAIQKFDQAVALDLSQVEALTYGGWLLRLVSQSVTDDGQRAELLRGALKRIDQAIELDPGYADARAFRGIIRLRDQDDPKAAIEDFAILDTVTVPDEVATLVGNARIEAEQAAAAR